MIYWLKSKN